MTSKHDLANHSLKLWGVEGGHVKIGVKTFHGGGGGGCGRAKQVPFVKLAF